MQQQQEEINVAPDHYNAIEAYLARSALQLNIMGSLEDTPSAYSLPPNKSLHIGYKIFSSLTIILIFHYKLIVIHVKLHLEHLNVFAEFNIRRFASVYVGVSDSNHCAINFVAKLPSEIA